jgi:Transposase domain (DUF772)
LNAKRRRARHPRSTPDRSPLSTRDSLNERLTSIRKLSNLIRTIKGPLCRGRKRWVNNGPHRAPIFLRPFSRLEFCDRSFSTAPTNLLSYQHVKRPHPAYHPALRLKVWLYAYVLGATSSRRVKQRIRKDLAFRYLAGGARPDFWALNEFRNRHGRALNDVFTQVVELARSLAMGKLGHLRPHVPSDGRYHDQMRLQPDSMLLMISRARRVSQSKESAGASHREALQPSSGRRPCRRQLCT